MRYGYKEIHELTTCAYLDARRHERSTAAQVAFEVDIERNIAALAHELYSRRWKPAPMEWFVLDSPTIREVFAPSFRDRVVSHILFNLISPIFERYFIFDSYSCRKGKGTLFGIERFEHHIRSVTDNYRREAWCLNIDISGYFMSINRQRLYGIIWKTLGKHKPRFPDLIDYDFADYLIGSFLFRDPVEGCKFVGIQRLVPLVPANKSLFAQEKGIGLPIGDVGNQLNSNIYLNELDHFVKRSLGVQNYCRYVDDARVLRADYHKLEEDKEAIGEFLDKELALTLHPEKTTITSLNDTNFYLGAAIKPYRRHAKNESVGRFKRYIKGVENALVSREDMDLDAVLASLNARLGYLSHFDEKKATSRILINAPTLRSRFIFKKDLSKAVLFKTK